MGFKRPESVLVVIYDDHGQVLVMQRNDDAEFWQSVTGTLEPDESPYQTARREVWEETGIDVNALKEDVVDCRRVNQYEIRQMWRHKYPPGTIYNTEHVFSLRVPPGLAITLTEHTDHYWANKPHAIDKVWSQSNKDAIDMYVPEQSHMADNQRN